MTVIPTRDELELRTVQLIARMTYAEKKAYTIFIQQGIPVYVQCPVSSYIADFVGMDRPFILECDGGSHAGHELYDARRDRFLTSRGFDVYRLSNEEVTEENIRYIVQQTKKCGIKNIRRLLAQLNKSHD